MRGVKKLFYAMKREYNRQKWYAQLYEAAYRKDIDALIVPTSTYRYLRALNKNILRRSNIPIIFVLHGINPKEAPKFLREAKKLDRETHFLKNAGFFESSGGRTFIFDGKLERKSMKNRMMMHEIHFSAIFKKSRKN